MDTAVKKVLDLQTGHNEKENKVLFGKTHGNKPEDNIMTCFYCHKAGHMIPQCRKKKRNEAASNRCEPPEHQSKTTHKKGQSQGKKDMVVQVQLTQRGKYKMCVIKVIMTVMTLLSTLCIM
jgi:hypothetical protein